MSQVCESPVQSGSILNEETNIDKSYAIFCSGEHTGTVENYIMIPIDGTGFVVIKEDIAVSGDIR